MERRSDYESLYTRTNNKLEVEWLERILEVERLEREHALNDVGVGVENAGTRKKEPSWV